MGRSTDYTKLFDKDYAKVFQENQSLKMENTLLKDENRRLKLELEKFKIVQDKDCTCSSIPSSATKFKKGITNSRKPTDKKPGASKGHKATYLSKKTVEKLKENPKTKMIQKTINLTKTKNVILSYGMY